ncbi:MAG: urea carboxylase-associated family protein [Thermomicrobium sp.]|nr:urea carboxylase-associated family protein [Thermomicrobium sp.]MDW7981857.1 urea carboxylase-associated family protein [Thermomicrobium sp.]
MAQPFAPTEHVLFGRVPKRAAQVRPTVPIAFPLKEGELLQITDVQGKQVAAMVAFNLHDIRERLSPAHTRAINGSLMLVQTMTLYSNRRNPMLVLLEDTVGRHDLLLPACDQRGYLDDYGISDHPSCKDNFLRVLAEYGIGPDDLPDPVNWFMNVGIVARGRFEIREPLSERNDYVLLRALMDLLVAVSACPQDQNACNAFDPSDILVRVYS